MTLICFASQKGSPGATATALAVAASLKMKDGRRKVLLEADTTGGTLAIRYRLPVEPGLLTLAAAVRGGLDSSEGLWRHAQELPGGLPVIVCPDGPEQVHAAMAAGGAQLGRFLNGLRDVDVMCDVGRLAPDSPAMPFVAEASALLMVARPTAEQLQPAARRMLMLRPLVSNLGWVLVGQKPYGPADVETTYDFPVVGVMADDPRSVELLERGTVSKRLRRQPFIRSATTLAQTLSSWLSPLTAEPGAVPADAATPVVDVPVVDVPVVNVPVGDAPVVEVPGSDESEPGDVDQPSAPISPLGVRALAESSGEGGPNVDLSLLPPPTGEPDTSQPSPIPVPEELVVGIRNEPEDEGTAEADDSASVPALESAPLFPPPAGPAADPVNPPPVEQPLLSDETDPFPTDRMHPVPPPPAPTGSRAETELPAGPEHRGWADDQPTFHAPAERAPEPVAAEPPMPPMPEPPVLEPPTPKPIFEPVAAEPPMPPMAEPPVLESETNGFAAFGEPEGLGWDELEPLADLAPPAAGPSPKAEPPTPPAAAENGSAILNGTPPVPPPSLAQNQPEPTLNGSPPLDGAPPSPPPSLAIAAENGQAAFGAEDDRGSFEEEDYVDGEEDLGEGFDDEEFDDDDWDGSEFTVTADLTHVFSAPDFDAPPIEEARTEPPMPPMTGVPPLPPPSAQLSANGTNRVNGTNGVNGDTAANGDTAVNGDTRDKGKQVPPSPFPHEDAGADWNGW